MQRKIAFFNGNGIFLQIVHKRAVCEMVDVKFCTITGEKAGKAVRIFQKIALADGEKGEPAAAERNLLDRTQSGMIQ